MTPIEERIKAQEEKLKQLKALKQKQEAKIRASRSKKARADDTRKKILVGAMFIDMMEKSDATKEKLLKQLDGFLTRTDDRALFDLAPLPQPVQPANPATATAQES
jgi:hypothetical protein